MAFNALLVLFNVIAKDLTKYGMDTSVFATMGLIKLMENAQNALNGANGMEYFANQNFKQLNGAEISHIRDGLKTSVYACKGIK